MGILKGNENKLMVNNLLEGEKVITKIQGKWVREKKNLKDYVSYPSASIFLTNKRIILVGNNHKNFDECIVWKIATFRARSNGFPRKKATLDCIGPEYAAKIIVIAAWESQKFVRTLEETKEQINI